MLLLLALAIEGEEALDLFRILPPKAARDLEIEAKRLLGVPKEARVPFLLREMKRIRNQAEASRLARVHPSWIGDALRQECPRVISIVLSDLPADRMDRITGELPGELASEVASLDGVEASESVQRVVRHRFAAAFVSAPDLRLATRFDHVASLRSSEVLEVILGLGRDELALACRALSREEMTQLFRKLPRKDEIELIARLKEYGDVDRRKVKQVWKRLSRILTPEAMGGDGPVKTIGLERFARASVPAEDAWCRFVACRLTLEDGRTFLDRRAASLRIELEDAGREQRAAVGEARRLAREGHLQPPWSKVFAE